MRCLYCHNPDTWEVNAGELMDTDYIIEQFERNRGFYNGGGITVTGGEPLVQIDFVTELFEKAKEKDINTCIDSSGITFNPSNPDILAKFDRLMKVTDLVMLDIKHIDNEKHKELTSQSNTNILAFAQYLSDKGIEIWIRHVLVPGYTDIDDYLYKLGYFIGGLKTLKALDVLPYHTMGEVKYEKLGIDYKLKGVPAMTQKEAIEKKQVILEGIKARRDEDSK
jgi:pyruvate formate lyase activating enzyme